MEEQLKVEVRNNKTAGFYSGRFIGTDEKYYIALAIVGEGIPSASMLIRPWDAIVSCLAILKYSLYGLFFRK